MHALRNPHAHDLSRLLLLVACIGIATLQPSTIVIAKAPHFGTETPLPQVEGQTSWGLGVVVPEGSSLSGGGTVSWAGVSNVTAVVQIPDLTNVSAATYAVVSLMTQDGVILQTAYGAFPGEGSWLIYAMFITNLNEIPQHYTWAANASEPAAGPGDVVTISIYQSQQGTWSFRASNLNTSLSIQKSFGANTTAPPKSGDQETLALESYANDSTMFQKMGNMTMLSLLLNGKRVESGWYLFADWDLVHNPLFVVGGAAPVPFVDLSLLKGGTAVWYYSGNWQAGVGSGGFKPVLSAVVVLAGVGLVSVFLSFRYMNRRGLANREKSGPEDIQARNSLIHSGPLKLTSKTTFRPSSRKGRWWSRLSMAKR